MPATATQPAAVEILDTFGSLTVVNVAGSSIVVHDMGRHYEVMGSAPEPYRITTRLNRQGMRVVDACTCPAGRYSKPCKHSRAVAAVLAAW